MLVTPVGLLVLSIRRCAEMKTFQFSKKDSLCLACTLLPAILLALLPAAPEFLAINNCLVVGAFQVVGGFFFWTHSGSKIGSWILALQFFLGAFVMSIAFAAIKIIGVFIAFFGSKYSDSNAGVFVFVLNIFLVGLCWFLGMIITKPSKSNAAVFSEPRI